MEDLNTVTKVFSAVLASLFGATAWMGKAIWRKTEETEKKLVKRAEECEAKHDLANEKVADLNAQVGELRGHMLGVQSISELSKRVLDAVANCPTKKDNRDA